MSRGRILAICLLLAGCDRVVLSAVEGPDDTEADADSYEMSDAGEGEGNDSAIEPAPDALDGGKDGSSMNGPVDAGRDSRPPMNMPLDASKADASRADAGDDGASPVRDAGPDAALPACGGTRALDLCWYLGAQGASCEQTCNGKGGFDARAIRRLGSAAQGGSLRACTQVLTALGYVGNVTPGYRSDGIGLGCHVWEERDGWWLETMPDFSPMASVSIANIACACAR